MQSCSSSDHTGGDGSGDEDSEAAGDWSGARPSEALNVAEQEGGSEPASGLQQRPQQQQQAQRQVQLAGCLHSDDGGARAEPAHSGGADDPHALDEGSGGGESSSASGGAELGAERRAAILAAMQRVQLDYRPPWAEVVPEERWMRRLRQGSEG